MRQCGGCESSPIRDPLTDGSNSRREPVFSPEFFSSLSSRFGRMMGGLNAGPKARGTRHISRRCPEGRPRK